MMAKLFVVAFSSVVVVATTLAQETASLTESITLAGAIATIIAAIFVGWVNVIAARAAATKAIAPVMQKVEKIEAHVNSEKTRDLGVIATLKQEVVLLREMMDEYKRAAALLAQAKSASELTQAVAGATGMSRPIESQSTDKPELKAIEKNTEDTATNTKKTDATVQALKDKT